MDHTATPSAPTQDSAYEALQVGIDAIHDILHPRPPDQLSLFPELVASCRELTDHLNGYAIAAERFDEDAFIACEKAERLLVNAHVAEVVYESPQGHR
jgi:hypothetical protein